MGCALLVIGVWAGEPVVAADGCIAIQLRLMRLTVQHYVYVLYRISGHKLQ
jgi:hypothetical protein